MDYKTDDDVMDEMSHRIRHLEQELIKDHGQAYGMCPDCDTDRGASGDCARHDELFSLKHDLEALTNGYNPEESVSAPPAPGFALN